MKRKLTQMAITAIIKHKQYGIHADGGGLYLHFMPNGSLKYRSSGGSLKIWTIGDYGGRANQFPLGKARKARKWAHTELAEGIDPLIIREAAEVGPLTVEVITMKWLDEMKGEWKHEREYSDALSRLKRYIFPKIGHLNINDVQYEHVLTLLLEVNEKYPSVASRLLNHLNSIFRFARMLDFTANYPTAGVRKHLKRAAPQHARDIGREGLKSVFRGIHNSHNHPTVKNGLKLLMHCSLLSNELRLLEVGMVNWRQQWLFVPKEIMKGRKGKERPHDMPLTRQTAAILRALETSTPNRFLFPSPVKDGQPICKSALKNALYRYEVESVSPNGMRATFTSWAYSQRIAGHPRFNSCAIEMQMAHIACNPITRAHNHALYIDERRELMQAWSDYLDEIEEEVEAEWRADAEDESTEEIIVVRDKQALI